MQSKIQRHQIYEIVMEQIRQDIAAGRLKPGDRLESVRELAQRLGVGQSSVREAVRVLSYMGLLHVQHGRGIFVGEGLSPRDIIDPREHMSEGMRTSLRHLIELRLVVEPAAARWAAERATPEECEEIKRRCDEVQRLLRRADYAESSEFQEQDIEFHMAILRAAHNPLLLDTLERVYQQLRISRQITAHVPQLLESALRFHPQVTQSILAHDMVRAENFMRAHMEDVLWWLERYDTEHRQSRAQQGANADDQGTDAPAPTREGLLETEFLLPATSRERQGQAST
jgi:GntR family transcriptional repressor for pyruvate dehydrogenase complex